MATLKQLAKFLNKTADELETHVHMVRAKVAIAIVETLVWATPVDTSKALSNWQVSTDSAGAAIGAHTPGKGGSSQSASASVAIAAAKAAVEAGRAAEVLVIFNSLPYIRRLNDGYSDQAPAGFVEMAILAGRLAARK